MAIRYAVTSGNWSSPSTWDGGASIPSVNDDVYANGFTVTLNQDIACAKISTRICPITSNEGGRFISAVSRVVVANVEAGSSTCLSSATGTYDQHFQIFGNVEGGSAAGAYGVSVNVSSILAGVITVIGNVMAGSAAAGTYIENNSSVKYAILNVTGTMTSSSSIPAHQNSVFPTLTINHIGNATSGGHYVANPSFLNFTGIATASSSAPAYVAFNTASIANVNGRLINMNAMMAIGGFYRMYLKSDEASVWVFYDEANTEKKLYTADVLENPPSPSDVRAGVVYGIDDAYTGTCAVPPPSSVALNVPVDDTVGTLQPSTPADFLQALKSDPLGIRLSKVATTEEVNSTVAAFDV